MLDEVSFTLERGKFHALLGPNGAGKSSLMRLLYRADRASRGRIVIDDREISAWPRRDYAAMAGALVQEAVTLSGLSLIEVVRLGLLPLRLGGAEVERRAEEALAIVGLLARAGEDATHLSGGEQQRLFFAQVLALDPEIYLLDEPHNHLDLHYQYVLLEAVKARGKAVLASFHDLTLAARFCDSAVLLDHGRVVAQGALTKVLTPERIAEVYRIDAWFEDGAVRIAGAL
nr:ABC transporter ATP-binding protein [Pelagibacterium limicola]